MNLEMKPETYTEFFKLYFPQWTYSPEDMERICSATISVNEYRLVLGVSEINDKVGNETRKVSELLQSCRSSPTDIFSENLIRFVAGKLGIYPITDEPVQVESQEEPK